MVEEYILKEMPTNIGICNMSDILKFSKDTAEEMLRIKTQELKEFENATVVIKKYPGNK